MSCHGDCPVPLSCIVVRTQAHLYKRRRKPKRSVAAVVVSVVGLAVIVVVAAEAVVAMVIAAARRNDQSKRRPFLKRIYTMDGEVVYEHCLDRPRSLVLSQR